MRKLLYVFIIFSLSFVSFTSKENVTALSKNTRKSTVCGPWIFINNWAVTGCNVYYVEISNGVYEDITSVANGVSYNSGQWGGGLDFSVKLSVDGTIPSTNGMVTVYDPYYNVLASQAISPSSPSVKLDFSTTLCDYYRVEVTGY